MASTPRVSIRAMPRNYAERMDRHLSSPDLALLEAASVLYSLCTPGQTTALLSLMVLEAVNPSLYGEALHALVREAPKGKKAKAGLAAVMKGAATGGGPGPWLGAPFLTTRILGTDPDWGLPERAWQALRWVDAAPLESVGSMVLSRAFETMLGQAQRRQGGVHYTPACYMGWVARLCTGMAEQVTATALAPVWVMDPSCGAGNFLAYAATIKQGHKPNDLIGLEIDPLAAALAWTASEAVCASLRGDVTPRRKGIDRGPRCMPEAATDLTYEALWADPTPFLRGLVSRSNPDHPIVLPVDAVSFDWSELFHGASEVTPLRVLGNPPFIGTRGQSPEMRTRVSEVFGPGHIDYAALWFYRLRMLIANKAGADTRGALISTASICQGEQASAIWPMVLDPPQVAIQGAIRPFPWHSGGDGSAAVQVVIICLGKDRPTSPKMLWSVVEQPPRQALGRASSPATISPYLVDSSRWPVMAEHPVRTERLNYLPVVAQPQHLGSEPRVILQGPTIYMLTAQLPYTEDVLRPYAGPADLLKGSLRKILLWELLTPDQVAEVKACLGRVVDGPNPAAGIPENHTQRQGFPPPGRCLAIPGVSADTRDYYPVVMLPRGTVTDPAVMRVEGSDDGADTPLPLAAISAILHSRMHAVWVDAVSTRVGESYQYGTRTNYQAFPLPLLLSGPFIPRNLCARIAEAWDTNVGPYRAAPPEPSDPHIRDRMAFLSLVNMQRESVIQNAPLSYCYSGYSGFRWSAPRPRTRRRLMASDPIRGLRRPTHESGEVPGEATGELTGEQAYASSLILDRAPWYAPGAWEEDAVRAIDTLVYHGEVVDETTESHLALDVMDADVPWTRGNLYSRARMPAGLKEALNRLDFELEALYGLNSDLATDADRLAALMTLHGLYCPANPEGASNG